MRRTVLLIAVLCGFLRAAMAGEPPVRVEDVSGGWMSCFAAPVTLTALPGRGGVLRTTVASPGWRVQMSATIPPDGSNAATVETTLLSRQSSTLSWSFAGESGSQRVAMSYFDWSYVDGNAVRLACVDGFMYADVEGMDAAVKPENISARTLPGEQLPRRWQSYAGFIGMPVLDGRAARQLSRERRLALGRWIAWLGGRVWLVGDGTARELDLELPAAPEEETDGVKRYRMLNGTIYVQAAADAQVLAKHANDIPQRDPLQPYYRGRYSYGGNTPGWILESLGGVSVIFIIVCLVVLGLVLGPLNYWYVRRRNNPLLFYLITPVVACLGTAAIVFGSMAVEGLGCRYNQMAVLVRRGSGTEAMMFDLRGVRSGFSTLALAFPADTLALPADFDEDADELVLDVTDGVTLVSGWLKPRFATGYLTARPVVSRMNVEVQEQGAEYYAVNGLGFALERVAAKLPDGGIGWADNVPAGGRALLRRERSDHRLTQLQSAAARFFGDDPVFFGASLVARAAGLPYQDDGGLGGWRNTGEYFYVTAGDAGGTER